MQVLFIAADLPWPPDGGGRIATLRVLEAIADRHTVDLIALADPASPPDLAYLRSLCRRVEVIDQPFTFGRHRMRQFATAAWSLTSRDPYRLVKFRSVQMRQRLNALKQATTYDLVHHDQFGVVRYHDPEFASTLTTQNVESDIYRLGRHRASGRLKRTWSRIEEQKLRRAEADLYPRFNQVFALSDYDADLLVGLGVETPLVLPIPMDVAAAPPSDPPAGSSILSLGSMSWFGVEEGLRWFHREVWPRILLAVPSANWLLVGPNASPAIRGLDDGVSIRVGGYVPDVGAYVRQARVCIVPLQIAGGVRIKLIEMLGQGRPAVATTIGAQGLHFADGEGCFRRDDPEGFANAVIGLLRDDDLWRRTSNAGWSFIRRAHSKAQMSTIIEQGIAAALRRHAGLKPDQEVGPDA